MSSKVLVQHRGNHTLLSTESLRQLLKLRPLRPLRITSIAWHHNSKDQMAQQLKHGSVTRNPHLLFKKQGRCLCSTRQEQKKGTCAAPKEASKLLLSDTALVTRETSGIFRSANSASPFSSSRARLCWAVSLLFRSSKSLNRNPSIRDS